MVHLSFAELLKINYLFILYKNNGLNYKDNKTKARVYWSLKVHKNKIFFGSEFEFCTISVLVMLKY
jgi:hypothetical protein